MQHSVRLGLLATSALVALCLSPIHEAKAEFRTSVDGGVGQPDRCNGAAECYLGTMAVLNAVIDVMPLPGTNPEIVVDSDTAIDAGQAGLTITDGNTLISVEHNVTNTTTRSGAGLEVHGSANIASTGNATSTVYIANGISLHSIFVDSGSASITASGANTTAILLGVSADIPNGVNIDGTLSAAEGANAVDFSAADNAISLYIDTGATLQGNLKLGQGDHVIFDDKTPGTPQVFSYAGDIIGDLGGGTEVVEVDAAGDIVDIGGYIQNVSRLDITAGTLRFGSTSGNLTTHVTSFVDGITLGDNAGLVALGSTSLDADITGSNGANTIGFWDSARLGYDYTGSINLLDGNDSVTLNDNALLYTGVLDLGAGDDTISFLGDATNTANGNGSVNTNIVGGLGNDRLIVNRLENNDLARTNGAISGIELFDVQKGGLTFDSAATIADTPQIQLSGQDAKITFFNNDGAVLNGIDMLATDTTVNIQSSGATYQTDITDSNGGISDNQRINLFAGTLNGTVTLQAGSNVMQINAGHFAGTYIAADGADTIMLIDPNASIDGATFNNADGASANLYFSAPDFTFNANDAIDGFRLSIGGGSDITFADDNVAGLNTALEDVMVNANGTLGGTGTIRVAGAVSISGGRYMPGNAGIGSQTISGNYEQSHSGALEIEFNDTTIDTVNVTGTATLAGMVDFVELAAGVRRGTNISFLHADGGLISTFDTVSKTFLVDTVLTDALLSYDANDAYVKFLPYESVDNNDDTDNSQTHARAGGRVTHAIDSAIQADSSQQNVLDIIDSLRTANDIDDALDSQSNVVTNSAVNQANGAIGQVITTVRARVGAGAGSMGAGSTGLSSGDEYAPSFLAHGNVWMQAVGAYSQIDGDADARGSKSNAYGGALGFEKNLESDDTVVGIFAGYTNSKTDIDGLQDESEVGNYQAGLYASHRIAGTPVRINGTLSGSYLDFETRRATVNGTAVGDFDGWGAYADAEVAYDFKLGAENTISPFVLAQGSVIDREGYTESGAGLLNNKVEGDTAKYFTSVLGVEVAGKYAMENLKLMPKFSLGWAHQYGDDNSTTTASFAGAQNVTFETDGPSRKRDSARIGLDLDFASSQTDSWSAFVRYNGDVADNAEDHMVRIGAGFKF